MTINPEQLRQQLNDAAAERDDNEAIAAYWRGRRDGSTQCIGAMQAALAAYDDIHNYFTNEVPA